MPDLILDIPFSEPPGSVVAHDYAPGNHNAQVVNGDFIIGKNHRAAKLAPGGYTEVVPPVFPLNGTWTLSIWLKAEITVNGPTTSWVLFHFANDQYLYLDLKSPLTVWSYLVLQQDTDRVRAYVNGHLTDVQLMPPGWGKPIGWAAVNDVTGNPSGNLTLEDLKLYNGIIDDGLPTDPDIPTDPQNPTYMSNEYYLDGVNFRTFGIHVTKSRGMIGNLDLKEPLMMNWPGFHGVVMDLTNPRYEARDITILCSCYGTSGADLTTKIRAFQAAFVKPGYRRLMRIIDGTIVLVYEVVLMKAIGEEVNWANLSATFTLNLKEGEPVKRVLRYSGAGQVSVTLSSPTPVNIYWGDNSVPTTDLYGANVTASHNYSSGGDHYISVTGVLEKMGSFSHNATLIYDRF